MIFVDRNKVPAPDILTGTGKKGVIETDRAIAYYSGGPVRKAFEFDVYRDPAVKEALILLFNGKCAYCESTFLHVYPGDIEHFRPKGAIGEATEEQKPGYYWLAANWQNLLLSCRNCNQKLRHALYGLADKRTMGKMNQFPLVSPGRHVRRHDEPHGIEHEEPFRLLLDPCKDNPEDHLEYGEQGVIRPRKNAAGRPSAKGETSIRVYVLQRLPLVLAREKLLIDIQAQIQRTKEAVLLYNNYLKDEDSTKRFYFEKVLNRELRRLKKFLNPGEPYVGMARQVIGTFLRDNFQVEI